ncbi:MAG: SAM hydroxide adenosyltransferase, partial [Opitutales bacterium]
DLFSHAAALMVQEGDLHRVCGTEVTPRCADWAHAVSVQPPARGEIVHIDAFGNVITNLQLPDTETAVKLSLSVPERQLRFTGLNRTYGDVETGAPLLLIGSHGFLEIAVRQGSAADQFGLSLGDHIHVE